MKRSIVSLVSLGLLFAVAACSSSTAPPPQDGGPPACGAWGVSLSADHNPAAIGQNVTFTPSITGGSGQYQIHWDLGDGRVADPPLPREPFSYTASYANAANYTVKVTVTDVACSSRQESAQLELVVSADVDGGTTYKPDLNVQGDLIISGGG